VEIADPEHIADDWTDVFISKAKESIRSHKLFYDHLRHLTATNRFSRFVETNAFDKCNSLFNVLVSPSVCN
jgi:hypothetical protein